MIRSNENISNALNIPFDVEEKSKEESESKEIAVVNTTIDTPLQYDFESARSNIKELIKSGMGIVMEF